MAFFRSSFATPKLTLILEAIKRAHSHIAELEIDTDSPVEAQKALPYERARLNNLKKIASELEKEVKNQNARTELEQKITEKEAALNLLLASAYTKIMTDPALKNEKNDLLKLLNGADKIKFQSISTLQQDLPSRITLVSYIQYCEIALLCLTAWPLLAALFVLTGGQQNPIYVNSPPDLRVTELKNLKLDMDKASAQYEALKAIQTNLAETVTSESSVSNKPVSLVR